MVVVGDKEIEQKTLTARKYGEQKQTTLSIDEWIQEWLQEDKEKIPLKLRQ